MEHRFKVKRMPEETKKKYVEEFDTFIEEATVEIEDAVNELLRRAFLLGFLGGFCGGAVAAATLWLFLG